MSAPGPGLDTAIVGVAACVAMVALWPWCGPMAVGTHRRLMVWSNVGSAARALTVGLGAQALWPVYLVAALMGDGGVPLRSGAGGHRSRNGAGAGLFGRQRPGCDRSGRGGIAVVGAADAWVATVHDVYPSARPDGAGAVTRHSRMREDLGEA